MKVLIAGGGGREHALACKCAASDRVAEVWVAPGNAGTAGEPKVRNVSVAAEDVAELLALARSERIDLTLIGPEAPLVAGVVDAFAAAGLPCFGPLRAAARLEGSKAFAKEFMRRHGIATAASRTFTRESLDAAWVRGLRAPLVLPLASSQDHKRLHDGDRGPNTGGMGAYSPAPVVTPAMHARVLREVIEPTVRGLAADGTPYTGFLYAGLMIAPDGTPRVLEFNCRLGDPETQPILLRLESDLTTLCEAALGGRLDALSVQWDPRAALGVVMAAAGYPERVRKGDVIEGLERAAQLPGKIFHAGTRLESGRVLTNGGRVLTATALGASVGEAQRAAYALADTVRWSGVQYRRDIGYRAVERERLG